MHGDKVQESQQKRFNNTWVTTAVEERFLHNIQQLRTATSINGRACDPRQPTHQVQLNSACPVQTATFGATSNAS